MLFAPIEEQVAREIDKLKAQLRREDERREDMLRNARKETEKWKAQEEIQKAQEEADHWRQKAEKLVKGKLKGGSYSRCFSADLFFFARSYWPMPWIVPLACNLVICSSVAM